MSMSGTARMEQLQERPPYARESNVEYPLQLMGYEGVMVLVLIGLFYELVCFANLFRIFPSVSCDQNVGKALLV